MDASAAIAALATAQTPNLPTPWKFVPTAPLKLNEKLSTAAELGELFYASPLYEIGPAVRIGAYAFCLEKLTALGRGLVPNAPPADVWVLSAFSNKTHYSFVKIPHSPNTQGAFLTWLIANIWPILAPDELPADGQPLSMSWEAPTDQEVVAAMDRELH